MATGRDPRRLHRIPAALLAGGILIACSAPDAPEQAAQEETEPQAAPTEPTSTTPPAAPASTPAGPVERPPSAPSPAPTKPAPRPIAPVPEPEPTAGQAPSPPSATEGTASFSVYMLSKGRGVPEPTREAYRDIRALLEERQAASAVSDLRVRRLGLEGETRLCAQFRDAADAKVALAEIRKRAAGVELLNVVEEPCPDQKGDLP